MQVLHKASAAATMLRGFNRSAKDRVEQHKSETGKQSHHGVAECEFLFDGFDQHVEYGAVKKVESMEAETDGPNKRSSEDRRY